MSSPEEDHGALRPTRSLSTKYARTNLLGVLEGSLNAAPELEPVLGARRVKPQLPSTPVQLLGELLPTDVEA